MYDELIKRLYENCILYQQAADAIAELEDRLAIADEDKIKFFLQIPRWIPATERPPEKEEIYWCYTNQGAMCECRWTNDKYGLGTFDRWGWNIMDVPQYQKITHWMPLPEPPKEE